MVEKFRSVGISFEKTSLDKREKVSIQEKELSYFLEKAKDLFGISEIIAISTCNRTELFYSSINDVSCQLFSSLLIHNGNKISLSELADDLIMTSENDTTTRLFNISIGLESQVIGDLQIINQIKKGYQLSADLNLAGPFLHRLMHSIFFTNKKVVQETAFRDGAASVSYATYELINELAESIVNPKVAIVGTGEMGKDIALHLKDNEFKNVLLVNRTEETATKLGKEFGFDTFSLNKLPHVIDTADIIVSSINHSEPIITSELVNNHHGYKFFIDIAVPRSIDKKVESINGVTLYTIDEIQNKTKETLVKSKKAIPQVESIIKDAIDEFNGWANELDVSPTIQRLKDALESIRKDEIEKYVKKMNTDQHELVELVTKSMVQKIIKLPVLELKAACQRGEAENLIDVLNGIFNLEEQPNVQKDK
ncbi:MAG: glutamyl-tRNA reductase [Cyclobacteriaceae bacterium]